jgi:hypothetical protein
MARMNVEIFMKDFVFFQVITASVPVSVFTKQEQSLK